MSTSCTVISDPAVIAAAIPAASPRFTQGGLGVRDSLFSSNKDIPPHIDECR